MSWWPRHFAAWLAALTSLALLLALASTRPKGSKGIGVLVPTNAPLDQDCEGSRDVIIHVKPDGLLLNGLAMSSQEMEHRLRDVMRTRATRIAFVDGDPTARFADVANVFSMLHGLKIQAAMLTPGLDLSRCLQSPDLPSSLEQMPSLGPPKAAVQPIAWWRFW